LRTAKFAAIPSRSLTQLKTENFGTFRAGLLDPLIEGPPKGLKSS